MTDRWQLLALQQRTNNNSAIAEAHVDAGLYGTGWLKIDEHGNLTRINPECVSITLSPDMSECDHDYMPKSDEGWGRFVCCRCGLRSE